MEIEWKIGEIRQVKGEWCQCVEGTYCKDCAYHNEEYDLCDTESQECLSHKRSDGKDVIFKKLEKVGNPFLGIVGGLNILYQRYSLPFTSKVTLEGPWFRINDEFIDIEIEQNKENMGDNNIKPYDKFFSEGTVSNTEHLPKSNLKPFDLQKAKDGKPVCTRDGRKSRIICFDRKGGSPIVALVETFVKEYDCIQEDSFYYTVDGRAIGQNTESKDDLMMLSERKEGWVNVYPADCISRII